MKTIYFGHSRELEYEEEIYKPIRNSKLNQKYNFIFPHENGKSFNNSKKLFESGKCDLFIAEVSHPATGLGIELGWASMLKIPIICVYKKGVKLSKSLETVTKKIIQYQNKNDLINKLEKI